MFFFALTDLVQSIQRRHCKITRICSILPFVVVKSRLQHFLAVLQQFHNINLQCNFQSKRYTLYEKQVPRVINDARPCAVQAGCSVCRPIIQQHTLIRSSKIQTTTFLAVLQQFHNRNQQCNSQSKLYTLYEKQVPRVVNDAGPCAVQAGCPVCRPIIQLG